ncbi:MAG: hypothetical protein M1821_004072 [Bathelium mastoideum]|nr:MAG: hypothetical protein M1821_004072 [Bathelium mastoideum]
MAIPRDPKAESAKSKYTMENYSFPTHRLKRVLNDSNRTPLVLVSCGSFSPITYLHLRMFEMARDYCQFNTQYEVVGGYLSPVGDAYKKAGLASAHHRINMCQLAIQDASTWIMVDAWEPLQSEYQPTARVLDRFDHELNEVHGGIQVGGQKKRIHVALLAGADLIQTMSSPGVWSPQDLDHILGNYGAFIIERAGTDIDDALASLQQWKDNIHVIPQLIQNDISSTKVRLFLKREMSVQYLIPHPVVRYIEENGLYGDDGASSSHEKEGKGELLPRHNRSSQHDYDRASPSPEPTRTRHKSERTRRHRPSESQAGSSASNPLSANSLAQLDALNAKLGWAKGDRVKEVHREEEVLQERERRPRVHREEERRKYEERRKERHRRTEEVRHREQHRDRRHRERDYDKSDHNHHRKKRRVFSGPFLEEGHEAYNEKYNEYQYRDDRKGPPSGSEDYDEEATRRKRRRIWIIAAIVTVVVLIIAIAIGVVVSKKKASDPPNADSGVPQPSNSNLKGISPNSIPASAKGTYYDPFTWYDTIDFNVTYTNETVGGLPIMGLNSTWNDNTRANNNVPPLNDKWQYGKMPIRGMNLGGWLSIEPFITPSLFNSFPTSQNIVDEWTLSSTLGPSKAASTLEQHYSAFIGEQDIAAIQAAGFDHVRISFSYWAVTTYDGDPYVKQTSWRYLLRAIEYCRKYGLRVNLDVHGLPGSQNGWNHSGRQGLIGWLNGTDGDLNGQRSLDIHNQLSTFFAQPRYQNLITLYGLCNEPRMVDLDTNRVLNWTTTAVQNIRKNNITAVIVFGDGFMGLDNWQGKLQGADPLNNLLLDVHQYVIFNTQQIALNHSDKLAFACQGWTQQTQQSMNTATGFGPTLCGEWSQADTDCTLYLNNVGTGSRWTGTLNLNNASLDVLSPACPTASGGPPCECADANADASAYSAAYKQWLLDFAEAQMLSFEKGWGWFYWTWATEAATQWSWKLGAQAGILPANLGNRSFDCGGNVPDFGAMGLPENY